MSACEAGPTGFGLARHLRDAGFHCDVVAPGLVPRRSSDRIKTDARDARKLALLYQGGMLAPVWVPSFAQEAVRDLIRAREDARGDLMRVRHRVSKLLLRHGHVYYGGNAWTAKHEAWLRAIRFGRGHGRRGARHARVRGLEQRLHGCGIQRCRGRGPPVRGGGILGLAGGAICRPGLRRCRIRGAGGAA